MLESTVKSSALTENLEAYRARIDTIGRALNTPSSAPAPHNRRLSASSVRRSDALLAPSAARIPSSASRRIVRARIRLATLEHAITNTSTCSQEHQQNCSGVGRDLIAQLHGADLEMSLRRIVFVVVLYHRCVNRIQLCTGLLDGHTRRQASEQLRHAVHASGHHRRRQMMRAGYDIRDDFRIRRIRYRRLQDADIVPVVAGP